MLLTMLLINLVDNMDADNVLDGRIISPSLSLISYMLSTILAMLLTIPLRASLMQSQIIVATNIFSASIIIDAI